MSDIFGNIPIQPGPEPTPAKEQPDRRLPRMKRKKPAKSSQFPISWIWGLVLGIALLLYSCAGFYGVPYYISKILPKTLSETKDINLVTREVRFNPFTFKLLVVDADLKDGTNTPLIFIKELIADFAPIQLLRMDLVCNHFKLQSPLVNITRDKESSYNWTKIFPRLKENVSDDAMMGFSDLPFLFSLNNIEISDGRIDFFDLPAGKEHEITDITLQLPTLSNMALQVDTYIMPVFSANINGSPITLKGDATLGGDSGRLDSTKFSSNIEGVDIGRYWNYLPADLPLEISSGTASGTIDFTFNSSAEDRDKIRIEYNLFVSDFKGDLKETRLQLKSRGLQFEGSMEPVQRGLHLRKLSLENPEFSYYGDNLTYDLLLLLPHQVSQTPSPQPVKPSLQLDIDSVVFKNGVLKKQEEGKKEISPLCTNLDFQLQNYGSQTKAKERDNKISLTLSGSTGGDNGTVLYSGTLNRNSELQGKFIAQEIPAEKIIKILLPSENLTVEGKGTVESNLTISAPAEGAAPEYTYDDVSLVLDDFKLINLSGTYFDSEHLRIEGGRFNKNACDFGNLYADEGNIVVDMPRPAELFHKFGSRAYNIDTFNFKGRLTLQPAETSASVFTLKDSEIIYSQAKVESQKPTITFKGTSQSGGKIDSEGTISFKPFSLVLNTSFNELSSTDIQSLLPETIFFKNSSGKLSGRGRITLPKATFTGDLTSFDGSLNILKTPQITWKRLNCEELNYNSAPYHLGIGAIRFTQPQLSVELDEGGPSFSQILLLRLREILRQPVDKPSKPEQIKISPVDIQELGVTEGSITIKDNRLSPPWLGKMEDIAGSIKDIHLSETAKQSPFSFTGAIDGAAFTWKGSFSPIHENGDNSHSFTLSEYPLGKVKQQLNTFFDINPDTATFDLSLQTRVEQYGESRKIEGHFHDLKPLSENSDVALVMAMLSDESHSFSLKTISQTAIDSSKGIFTEFVEDMQTKIVKVNLSPLLLANGDYSDLIGNEFIEFIPGEFMLSDSGRNTLNRYGALLIAHPQIKLTLWGGAGGLSDKPSLHKQLEQHEAKRVEQANEKLFRLWTEKKKEYEEQVKQQALKDQASGNISELDIPTKVLSGFTPLQPEPVVVDEEMLIDLADKRLNIVKNHFISQLSLNPQRIEVQFPTGIDKNTEQHPGVEISIGAL